MNTLPCGTIVVTRYMLVFETKQGEKYTKAGVQGVSVFLFIIDASMRIELSFININPCSSPDKPQAGMNAPLIGPINRMLIAIEKQCGFSERNIRKEIRLC